MAASIYWIQVTPFTPSDDIYSELLYSYSCELKLTFHYLYTKSLERFDCHKREAHRNSRGTKFCSIIDIFILKFSVQTSDNDACLIALNVSRNRVCTSLLLIRGRLVISMLEKRSESSPLQNHLLSPLIVSPFIKP